MARRKSIIRGGLEQYLIDQTKGYAVDKVKKAREKKKRQKEMEKKKRMG